MSRNTAFLSSLSLLLLAGVPSRAAALVIDDFTTGPAAFTALSPFNPIDVQNAVGLDVLGGRRLLTQLAASGGVESSATYEIDTTDGVFRTTSNDTEGRSTFKYFKFDYGSLDDPLGVDLTADNADRFRIRYRGPNPGLGIRVELQGHVDGEFARLRGSFGSTFNVGPRDAIVELPFDQLFGNAAVLEDVDAIIFSNGRQLGDAEIDLFETGSVVSAADFNRDSIVDENDLAFFHSSFAGYQRIDFEGVLSPTAQGAEITTADANKDGRINAADLTIWRDSVVTPTPFVQSATVVPEPAAGALVCVAVVLVGAIRSRVR